MNRDDSGKLWSLLTVGDGDLSASLAILRAYRDSPAVRLKRVVATTLLSNQEELIATYPNSAKTILEELESSEIVTVLYQVDATQLHTHPELQNNKLDLVLFQHPHLGYTEGMSSEEHAARHSALLAHYLNSAQSVLADGGFLHVCLCTGAAQSWKLDEMVHQLKLALVVESAASRPLLEPIVDLSRRDAASESTMANRTTKGASRRGHWLGRYGYRHQPTFPHVTEFQTNVSSSSHYFFRPTMDRESRVCSARVGSDDVVCPICLRRFEDTQSLRLHMKAPALPLPT
jgi:Domain of unknown function (DUF2431)